MFHAGYVVCLHQQTDTFLNRDASTGTWHMGRSVLEPLQAKNELPRVHFKLYQLKYVHIDMYALNLVGHL